MVNSVESRKNFIINFIYFGIIIGLFYFWVKYAFGYIFPFVVAATLAVLLQRPIRAICKKFHIKAHSAISTVLVLLIVVGVIGAVSGAITFIVNELKDFFGYLFTRFDSIGDFIDTIEKDVLALIARLPQSVEDTVAGYVTGLFDKINLKSPSAQGDLNVVLKPLLGAWGVVKNIPSVLLSVVVTIISCVFMTAEYTEIKNMILGFCSKEKGEKLIHAKKTVLQGVGKLFKAYATIMLITFTEMFLGLNLMKLMGVYNGGYIAVIAFVTCIVDIVPVLGTGTVLIPWALLSFITNDIGLGVGLIILYIVITVLRQAIEPRLVAHQVGLPAIITVMAMFIGAKLFGALGIVLVPLTVVVIKLMYDDGIIGNKNNKETFLQTEPNKNVAETNEEVKND